MIEADGQGRRRHHTSIPSTNAAALDWAATEGGPSRLEELWWVTSDEQTAGRGRRGRDWSSPPGNLYATALVNREALPDAAFGVLPFAAALALRSAIVDLAPHAAIDLKWPNDLLLNGGKLAGILLEARTSSDRTAVAIGFGVNCSSHPNGGSIRATDLHENGIFANVKQLFDRLAVRLRNEMVELGSGDAVVNLLDRWRDRAYGIGQPATVRLHDREISGIFQSLASDGRLVLAQADGTTETIAVGDVFFPNTNGSANKPAFEQEKATQ